ncbi:CWC16 protein [Terfezia claveryi]|nr:CWC16 protein [Terfezia claveryi]
MSERKVLQKYYPPEFDPSKITRHKGPKPTGPKQQTVRLMTPFSMRCNSCGEYIYKGRKFNARKENSGEKYFNISIFRFYIRCTQCSAEITFKTSPKHMDYECEKGATRNFEPWREAKDQEETEEERLTRLEEEENESAMAKLETKTLDSKREMMIADALDEIRTRNARMERKDHADVLETLLEVRDEEALKREQEEQEIEEAAKKAFSTEDGEWVRRVVDEETGGLGLGGSSSSSGPAAVKSTPVASSSVALADGFEVPEFKRMVKRKKPATPALPGLIKKKQRLPGIV